MLFTLVSFFSFLAASEATFGYRGLVRIREPNRTLQASISQIKSLIDKATKEIIIVSGSLNHEIYDNIDILNSLSKKCEKIKNGDLCVSIYVTGDMIDTKTENFRKLLIRLGIPVQKLVIQESMDLKHFVIVDMKHVRIEDNHDLNGKDRRAFMKFYAPYLATRIKDILQKILETSPEEYLELESKGENHSGDK